MSHVSSLGEIMGYATKMREVSSNNIANQNTNGFKAEVVSWDENMNGLKTNLKTTKENHISVLSDSETNYSISQDESTQITSNGNNVDLNNEMIKLLKANQISSMAIQAYNKFSEARSAARGN